MIALPYFQISLLNAAYKCRGVSEKGEWGEGVGGGHTLWESLHKAWVPPVSQAPEKCTCKLKNPSKWSETWFAHPKQINMKLNISDKCACDKCSNGFDLTEGWGRTAKAKHSFTSVVSPPTHQNTKWENTNRKIWSSNSSALLGIHNLNF